MLDIPRQAQTRREFLRGHLVVPGALWFVLVAVLAYWPADRLIADALFAWEGGTWRWRDAWFTATVIHDGGRTLVGWAAALLLVASLAVHLHPLGRPWRSEVRYLLCASIGAGVLINVLKQVTQVDCPWDLQDYGGIKPDVGLLGRRDPAFEPGACFPAGHASAGYAWFPLYFVSHRQDIPWRGWVLAGVMGVGLVFGIGQQLRGAHFLSHDIWTAGLCWLWSAAVFVLWFPDHPAPVNPLGSE